MNARVTDIRYRMGFDPVTIVVTTPFGETRVQTSQSTLTARAGGSEWGDEHVRSVAQDGMNAAHPGVFTIVE